MTIQSLILRIAVVGTFGIAGFIVPLLIGIDPICVFHFVTGSAGSIVGFLYLRGCYSIVQKERRVPVGILYGIWTGVFFGMLAAGLLSGGKMVGGGTLPIWVSLIGGGIVGAFSGLILGLILAPIIAYVRLKEVKEAL